MLKMMAGVAYLLLIILMPILALSAPEIRFSFGRVQGVDKQAYQTQMPFFAFYGIPFARPPVGELRFRSPLPFNGTDPEAVISSTSFRPSCMQYLNTTEMSEDCLYLNVYTPPDLSEKRKVMIWIHGGSFYFGDATMYVPAQMVTEKDVIVVVLQYRLAAFGFLTSLNGDGNNGLKDQILAIKWVKDNIAQFNGDADDITIFGESAGAASVSLLSISPKAKGLFTKVIMQSGTAIAAFAMNKKPLEKLNSAAERLGCSNPTGQTSRFKKVTPMDKINCLRQKTSTEILSLNIAMPSNNTRDNDDDDGIGFWSWFKRGHWRGDRKRGKGRGKKDSRRSGWDREMQTTARTPGALYPDDSFLPVIDGEVIPRSPQSLMTDTNYLKNVGALNTSYLIGVTNNEGLIIFTSVLELSDIANFTIPQRAESFFTESVSTGFSDVKLDEASLDLVKYEYSYPRLEDGSVPMQGVLDLVSDILFVVPMVQFARALTKASNSTKLFVYLFNHFPQLLHPDVKLKGSMHGLDVIYEFDPPKTLLGPKIYADAPLTSEGNLTNLFRESLTQFAKSGSPTTSPETWPRFNPKEEYYFSISMTPQLDKHLYAKRVALWSDFLFKKAKGSFDLSKRWWRF